MNGASGNRKSGHASTPCVKPGTRPTRHRESASLILRLLAPASAGLLHALLESHGHLCFFTVLDARAGLLRLRYSKSQESEVNRVLALCALDVPILIRPWPFAD